MTFFTVAESQMAAFNIYVRRAMNICYISQLLISEMIFLNVVIEDWGFNLNINHSL